MNKLSQISYLEKNGLSVNLLKEFSIDKIKKYAKKLEGTTEYGLQRAILQNPAASDVLKKFSMYKTREVFCNAAVTVNGIPKGDLERLQNLSVDEMLICLKVSMRWLDVIETVNERFCNSANDSDVEVLEKVVTDACINYLQKFSPKYQQVMHWSSADFQFVEETNGQCRLEAKERYEKIADVIQGAKKPEAWYQVLNECDVMLEGVIDCAKSASEPLEILGQVFHYDFSGLDEWPLSVLSEVADLKGWNLLSNLKLLEGVIESSVLRNTDFYRRWGVDLELEVLEILKEMDSIKLSPKLLLTTELLRFYEECSHVGRQILELGGSISIVQECMEFESEINSPAILVWNLARKPLGEWMQKYNLEKKDCIRVISYSYHWDEIALKYRELVIRGRLKKHLLFGGIQEYVNSYRNYTLTNLFKERVSEMVSTKFLDTIQDKEFMRFLGVVKECFGVERKIFIERFIKYVNGEPFCVPFERLVYTSEIPKLGRFYLDFVEKAKLALKIGEENQLESEEIVVLFLNFLDGNKIFKKDTVFSIREANDRSLVLLREFGKEKAPRIIGIPVSDEEVVIGITGAPYVIYGRNGVIQKSY